MKSLPVTSKIAAALLVLLALGPLISGFDLAFHFMPTTYPAIQNLHAATTLAKLGWLASGVLAIVSALLMARAPTKAAIAAFLFVGAYVAAAQVVWLHFTPGCWLAIAAFVLTTVGAYRHEA